MLEPLVHIDGELDENPERDKIGALDLLEAPIAARPLLVFRKVFARGTGLLYSTDPAALEG